ncbi:sterile alpha motif domain-containing protein 9 [Megalobrama amblycephala]|uniref:sterile alpha motif domain-containing protein 9 n=1 Tax=Megalobrama amblycephala TaxID=75352 RepID=UPI0020145F7F|nr:sterile alpha motif domain-containing protein 9 [Megalobrama amblycephala]XP_048055865.1 sterile alpha motif domain-containing protein 9 [Megalobrama amblycephala]XP_048055873.1 sterile alpha motif domain-containing protein 9 [Megalobrama amblycephala]XP_048055882.1 sterile alpha motif domain-containing protein 9 [Megalobrama amblycephala]
MAVSSELPVNINDWNKDHVRQWMLDIKVDKEDAEILYNQRINGAGLLLLDETDLSCIQSLSLNAKKLIIHNIGLLKQKTQQQNDVVTQSYSLKPYPFNRFNAAHRYRENSNLDVTETGPIDLIQPCHEFKAFTNTTEENRIKKFTYEVIRFAAACMNSRTNGTIHFGVADKPHGQILGINVQSTDVFDSQQSHAIEKHFKSERFVKMAKRCIKPPRFVEVLKADMTSAGKRVIEVDIEPSSIVCEEFHFNTYNVDKNEGEMQEPNGAEKKQNDSKSFFIRDGSSSKNLITSASSKEYEKYTATANMHRLSQLRKDAEEKHLSVVKNSVQGSKLCEMITGGTQSLDRSHFEWNILVVNKSHPVQLENLDFLVHMNLVAVLDFDPESAENGLNKILEERKMTSVHLPAQYKVTGAVEDILNKLKLTKNTSWVFCNGGIHEENPSDADHWLTEKGSSVRDVVSFLCRRDVLPRKKLLTIFLLLSQVSDANDPLLETFSMFLQELKGGNQILCISDNETTYTYWKDLIKGRYKVDISKRCIYELSFAEVNGTILSLWSENRKSSRFLPCGGGSNVVLSKKTEESLETLSVLCVNQCDGGNEDKQHHEENFYKGGKVSWWNFYFSEQPGSMPFIKRDKFDYIVNTIIPDICSRKRACEFFNIFHLPGCGGTTLAMHVLWTLKDKFRCAVMKDTTDDYSTVAEQVVQLLTYETKEQPTRLPVLLMIDDFQDICDVKKLQLQIEEECLKQNIFSKSPQVIIVNCMRAESCEQADDTVFIGNRLSEKEQKLFEEKLKEFEKTNTNTKTFYGFMILKNNFSSDYIQGVVKNTLKGFNFQDKHSQLFAVLVLLHVYCKNALLSASTCEEFLGLQTKPNFEVEDGFEKFSTLLTRCIAYSNITFEGVRVIHSSIAQHCLKQLLTLSYKVSKAEITNLLLTTDLFYEYTLGKQKLMQDVHNMLVKRQYSAKAEDSLFSPLIQHIMKETPGMEEIVLHNAAKRYSKDAVIFQLLARYYIKKQDFTKAMSWAKKAKGHSKDNSYICDTVSQVLVRGLKHVVHKDRDDPIKPESLDGYLTLAESAAEACKETQQTANKEAVSRLQRLKDYNTYNTAGHLGELQTAATVIQILQKTPLLNCLGQVLLGKITIEELSRKHSELMQYCDVLQKHNKYLLQLKHTMKDHFDFLDNFFVNLVPFFAEKDKQKELTKPKVSRYFQQYTELFCKINWSELVNNESMNRMVKIDQTRQCLERNKGDSYSSLLEYLYEKDSASSLEEIIRQYHFILKSKEARLMDIVNFVYANVILANINPTSQYIMPYQDLRELLLRIIDRPIPFSEILPLHYITVLLLWHENCALPTSQMKTSYSTKLKPVSNGKRAAVHFYLGKDKGYGGLFSHRDINSWLRSGQDISTHWDDEKIWKKVRDSNKLHRVSGKICDGFISIADRRVDPLFRSQLHNEYGTRVTFFIGFSMNGPVAFDIDFDS